MPLKPVVDLTPKFDILDGFAAKERLTKTVVTKTVVTLPTPKVFDLTPGLLTKVEANTDRAQVTSLAPTLSFAWKG